MPEPIGDSRLIEMPGPLIRRLHQISFALFLDQAKAFGVTPVQYAALVAINRHPGIDQTTLCNIIAFDRTTIGGVVGRLQRKKLITRVNGAHDRRTKAMHITPAGRAAYSRHRTRGSGAATADPQAAQSTRAQRV